MGEGTPAEPMHVHAWQPQGLIREQRESCSPCSTWDDVLWTQVIAVQSCACGKVRRVDAGTENMRRRGDDLRRSRRSRR